jgi:menaquinone-dependent protoporphyrinogen IX oxidase
LGKLLIAYDSGYGATTDAAKTIMGNLTQEGWNVDLSFVGMKNPVGYDAVLIGSPIRLSQCTPKIKKFLKRNHTMLACMKVAFFFTCMSVTNDKSRIDLPLYIDPCFKDPNKPRARIKAMENNHTVSC